MEEVIQLHYHFGQSLNQHRWLFLTLRCLPNSSLTLTILLSLAPLPYDANGNRLPPHGSVSSFRKGYFDRGLNTKELLLMHPSLATADGTAGLIILNFDCH